MPATSVLMLFCFLPLLVSGPAHQILLLLPCWHSRTYSTLSVAWKMMITSVLLVFFWVWRCCEAQSEVRADLPVSGTTGMCWNVGIFLAHRRGKLSIELLLQAKGDPSTKGEQQSEFRNPWYNRSLNKPISTLYRRLNEGWLSSGWSCVYLWENGCVQ